MLTKEIKIKGAFGDHLADKLHDRADFFARLISDQMTKRAQQGEHFASFFNFSKKTRRQYFHL